MLMTTQIERASDNIAPRLGFRMATKQDGLSVVALLNETFRTPIDLATWEWYVYGNPHGPSRVYLALDTCQDRVVGVIAFSPTQLRLQGMTVAGTYAHHLALNPDYRDTLSFVALNRYALQAEGAQGVKFTIGPPNRTAYPIHKTLMKWVDFGYLDCLRKLKPSAQRHACREVRQFSLEFDELYRRVSRNLTFCVEKTAAWMNWRFCQRPGSPYTFYATSNGDELTGYVILKRWQDADGYRKAHILDLHAVNDRALSQLIAAAENFADGCDELNLWAIQDYLYRDPLERMGFASGVFRQPLIVRPLDGSAIAFPEGNKSLSYGDGDTLY